MNRSPVPADAYTLPQCAPPGADGCPEDAGAEARLMTRVQDGDPAAFEAIYDRFATPAYRLALRICGDPSRAEDAVQDAFLSIWRNPGTYANERGRLAAWLLSVVRHRALDARRWDGSRPALPKPNERPVGASTADTAAEALRRCEERRLRTQLNDLPATQREAVVLAFYGGLSHAEIARLLDLPPGTIKGRIRLGLEKLAAAERAAAT